MPLQYLEQIGGARAEAVKCAGLPLHVPTESGRKLASTILNEAVFDCLAPLKAAKDLRDPQHIVYVLSRGGSWTRLQYHLATLRAARVPHVPIDHPVREADAVTADLLAVALGSYARAAGSVMRLVASLPRSMGGLGIPLCALEASLLDDTAEILRETDASHINDALIEDITARRDKRRSQLLAATRRAVLSAVGRTSAAAARLAHQATKGAAAPWSVPASKYPRTIMNRPEAQMALFLWLLGQVGDQLMPCGEKISTAHSTVLGVGPSEVGTRHVVQCKRLFTRRHHAICQAAGQILTTRTGAVVRFECGIGERGEPVQGGGPGDRSTRPGDFVVRPRGGRPIFADVTVTMTSQAFITATQDGRQSRPPTPPHDRKRRQSMWSGRRGRRAEG